MVSAESSRESGNLVETAAVAVWADRHAASMLGATVLAAATASALPIAVVGAASCAALFLWGGAALTRRAPVGGAPGGPSGGPPGRFSGGASAGSPGGPIRGYANLLTATRLALVLGIASFLTHAPAALIVGLLSANVLLDAVDGRVARRRGEVTVLGTVFDREADALFVLVAYAYFFLVLDYATWVLLPGVLPYAYRLGIRLVPGLREGEAKQPIAAVLAGCNYLVLLAAIAASDPVRRQLVMLSVLLVLSSFLISLARLLRREGFLS